MPRMLDALKRLFRSDTSAAPSPPSNAVVASEEALAFLNNLSGVLKIRLTEEPRSIGGLSNVAADASAELVSLRLDPEVFVEDSNEFRQLTEEELNRVVFTGSRLLLRGEAGKVIIHRAPDGGQFTVRDVIDAVIETERRTRDRSEWFGGIDVQHVFFEGLHPESSEVWQILWGS